MSLKEEKRISILGRLSIFATAVIWGSSFVVLKNTLDSIPTFYVLALRFTGATLLMLILGCRELKKLNFDYVKSGVVMGVLLFIAYSLQTYGLLYTTPGKNAFLTATYCIVVPFLYWLISKKRPDAYNIIAALVCIVGVGFISLEKVGTINIGDILTICCGIFYAMHIIATNKYAAGKSVLLLTAIQLGVAGVLSWVFALLTGPFPREISSNNIWSMVYLCVMCTAACYVLQTFGQKHTPPSSAALIMTLESVFGALFSIALGYESINPMIIIGFVLIFSAVIVSETKLGFLRLRDRSAKSGKDTG